MLRRSWTLAGFAAALAAATYVYAQMPEIRPGQWSFTMSADLSALGDTSDLPPEVLAQIREQMSRPNTYQSCVTPQDIADLDFGSDDEDCMETSREIDANVVTLAQECGDSSSTLRIEVFSPERISMSIDTESDDGASTISVSGEWVAATCTDD